MVKGEEMEKHGQTHITLRLMSKGTSVLFWISIIKLAQVADMGHETILCVYSDGSELSMTR